jgi:flagellar basal body-associated protein FliL
MSKLSPAPAHGAAVPASPSDTRRTLWIVAAVTALISVPVGVSVGMSWVDMPWSEPTRSHVVPDWVTLPTVRATTSDGTVVKARVALDVPDGGAKSIIQRNVQQVGLLLEVSIAQQTRAQIGSPQGIPRLADDMRDRLNAYLESDEEDPLVKSVAIQDLLVKPQ